MTNDIAQILHSLPVSGPIDKAVLAADRLVTAADGLAAQLWDIWKCQRIGEAIVIRDASFWLASLSPDGTILATDASSGRVWLWHTAYCDFLCELQHLGDVNVLVFSFDSQLVITGGTDGMIRLWYSRTGTLAADPIQYGEPIYAFDVSADGAWLVACGISTCAKVVDVHEGRVVAVLEHEQIVLDVKFGEQSNVVVTQCAAKSLPLNGPGSDAEPLLTEFRWEICSDGGAVCVEI